MRKLSYTADFETTTDKNNCRVWAWATANITTCKMEGVGNDISTFIDYIRNKNIDLYFHNLKFDGEFIISYLLNNGFRHSRDKEAGTFETVISDSGLFFKLTIIWSVHNKRYVKTDIYDSLKKLPFSVEVIAKAFNLNIKKGNIDYDLPRPVGHIITADELDYIKNDVEITAQALNIQFNEGLKKMTIGADALNGFKLSLGDKRNFLLYYPVLDKNTDDFIRASYKGGFTYLNPIHKGVNHKGLVFDVNSLYPSVMYDKPLPYGLPIEFKGEYEYTKYYPLYIQRIYCSFKVKKGFIPTIQLKNSFRFIPTEYLTSSKGDIVELILTSIDLKLFLDHYDVLNLSYGGGLKFKSNDYYFKNYIEDWSFVKAHNTGAMRTLAKLMLNSLYGKFGSSTLRKNKIPYLKDKGEVGYYYEEAKTVDPVYTAIATFTTSYARDITIRSAQTLYDRFIYCDTDSLHLIGYDIPTNIYIHDTELGAWAHESTFTASKFLRAKTYIEVIDNKLSVVCAGMPKSLHKLVNLDNFNEGMEYGGKLRPVHVKGGIVLEATTFKIR